MGRNTLKLDVRGFEEYIQKLERLGSDIKPIVGGALQQAGEKIGTDTISAVQQSNLPAGGKYSGGDTESSVVKSPKVEWAGSMASIGVGFDYGKPGAGGFLISGTPKMKPDRALQKIYKQHRYMKEIEKDIIKVFNDEIEKRMGG